MERIITDRRTHSHLTSVLLGKRFVLKVLFEHWNMLKLCAVVCTECVSTLLFSDDNERGGGRWTFWKPLSDDTLKTNVHICRQTAAFVKLDRYTMSFWWNTALYYDCQEKSISVWFFGHFSIIFVVYCILPMSGSKDFWSYIIKKQTAPRSITPELNPGLCLWGYMNNNVY